MDDDLNDQKGPSHSSPTLRILCLHAENSNASQLKKSLDRLGERLYTKYGIDLVYVQSPLLATGSDGWPLSSDEENVSSASSLKRVWWWDDIENCADKAEDDGSPHDAPDLDDDDLSTTNRDPDTGIPCYRGLDASRLLLRQVWNSGPFWGILGMGQGAALAAWWARTAPATTPVSPPAWALLISGRSLWPDPGPTPPPPPPPPGLVVVEDHTSLPVLHLIDPAPLDSNQEEEEGLSSSTSTRSESQRLVQLLGGQVQVRTTPGHPTTKFSAHELNVMGRFICRQRQDWFRGDTPGTELVAWRRAWHELEAAATQRLVAEIAQQPPTALMAVILPQAVAGWKGNKRRSADEQGGGAPCPSEFLLQREKRSQALEEDSTK